MLFDIWAFFQSELNIDGVLDHMDIVSHEAATSCCLRFVSSLPYERDFHFDLQCDPYGEFSLTVNTFNNDVLSDVLFRALPGFKDELKSVLGSGSFNCLAFNKLDPLFRVTTAFVSEFEFFRTIKDVDIFSNGFPLLIGEQLSDLCGSFTANKLAFEKCVTEFNDFQLNKPLSGGQLDDGERIMLAHKLFCHCGDNKSFFNNFCLPEPHQASAILDIAQEIAQTLELQSSEYSDNSLFVTYQNISPYCVGLVKNHFRGKNVIDHLEDFEGVFSHQAFLFLPILSEALDIQLEEFNAIKLSQSIDLALSNSSIRSTDLETEVVDISLSVSNSL
ncbi:hypothetical protein [Shewanella aestuarii]|uniref:Uncharacterized protein n=1 Tax=Shewanella aestuarii TaxID=1028752 RepID=A0A6G9QQ90_9GAMM|nr:hypothetical protein [Shewanella aestuarii]QIR16588.1 hypothetical protein HBH39_19120 [Shewanella aestuarii]